MRSIDRFGLFAQKMRIAGVHASAIRAFQHSYETLASGDSGQMPESMLEPVLELPRLEDIGSECAHTELLSQTVLVKLNGGLGTGMGLERAKSLLPVKGELTFLDFIARQVLHLRSISGGRLSFMIMNSFATSEDTRDFLTKYPELEDPIELLQNQVPKVDARTLEPATWPANPQLEWCPPGHGDIYPSLLGSGALDELLERGITYAFVSNSDNLGASLDPGLLSYFVKSGYGFMMEVAERTEMDKKGGHLARADGVFVLRESAQCPAGDTAAFQDIQRHRFFNTNNLWIRLDALKELIEAGGGFLKLPIIKNTKTVDPRDANSAKVYQLETAMGAAIQCFSNAGAIVVPRRRFAPVKTTSDLLAVRSDAYRVSEDCRLEPAWLEGPGPIVELEPNWYKLVDQVDQLSESVPSLKSCRKLQVVGPVRLSQGTSFAGDVRVENASNEVKTLPPGLYKDQVIRL